MGTSYRDRVLGCWIGKNIGGTIGAPFEWKRQINNVTFYAQKDLDGSPMPNDDLDIQLLWLCAMEERGVAVNAHRLAEYWTMFVTPHWSEYGIAKANMRQGLPPPLCGTYRNDFKNSCGSYIRSEIWACLNPGDPDGASRMAYEDAIIDHGNGEGVYAEIFMASLESAAFVLPTLDGCVDAGLARIPEECRVAQAVATVRRCRAAGMSWLEARDEVLRLHSGVLMSWAAVSDYDKKEGHTGTYPLGCDVPSNIAITLIGLYWGGEDFSQVQCICVNCGEDTDCSAATSGSVWGIMHGADAIPQKWIDPIGRGIRTVCLNLGELGNFGDQLPSTVDELTDRTVRLAERINPGVLSVCGKPQTIRQASDHGESIWGGFNGPRYDFDFFSVHLDYGDGNPAIRDGQCRTVTLRIHNKYKTQANFSVRCLPPDGFSVSPQGTVLALSLQPCYAPPAEVSFTFKADSPVSSSCRGVIEITAEGRPVIMLVPVVFVREA